MVPIDQKNAQVFKKSKIVKIRPNFNFLEHIFEFFGVTHDLTSLVAPLTPRGRGGVCHSKKCAENVKIDFFKKSSKTPKMDSKCVFITF